MPLCGPWSPPLALWPQTSTPNVLLSTHCIPSKSSRVKAAAVKVKTHLFAGPFVQGCHYAGCDQATKFSSKINRPPPPPLSPSTLSVSPGRGTPRQRVFSLSLHPISGKGPAPCLFSFQYPSFCILLLFGLSRLRSTLSHNPYPFFSSSSSTSPLFPYFYFGMPLYSHLIFSPPPPVFYL